MSSNIPSNIKNGAKYSVRFSEALNTSMKFQKFMDELKLQHKILALSALEIAHASEKN